MKVVVAIAAVSFLSLGALAGAASEPLRSEAVGNPLKFTCQYLNYYAETAPASVNKVRKPIRRTS